MKRNNVYSKFDRLLMNYRYKWVKIIINQCLLRFNKTDGQSNVAWYFLRTHFINATVQDNN